MNSEKTPCDPRPSGVIRHPENPADLSPPSPELQEAVCALARELGRLIARQAVAEEEAHRENRRQTGRSSRRAGMSTPRTGPSKIE